MPCSAFEDVGCFYCKGDDIENLEAFVSQALREDGVFSYPGRQHEVVIDSHATYSESHI